MDDFGENSDRVRSYSSADLRKPDLGRMYPNSAPLSQSVLRADELRTRAVNFAIELAPELSRDAHLDAQIVVDLAARIYRFLDSGEV